MWTSGQMKQTASLLRNISPFRVASSAVSPLERAPETADGAQKSVAEPFKNKSIIWESRGSKWRFFGEKMNWLIGNMCWNGFSISSFEDCVCHRLYEWCNMCLSVYINKRQRTSWFCQMAAVLSPAFCKGSGSEVRVALCDDITNADWLRMTSYKLLFSGQTATWHSQDVQANKNKIETTDKRQRWTVWSREKHWNNCSGLSYADYELIFRGHIHV